VCQILRSNKVEQQLTKKALDSVQEATQFNPNEIALGITGQIRTVNPFIVTLKEKFNSDEKTEHQPIPGLTKRVIDFAAATEDALSAMGPMVGVQRNINATLEEDGHSGLAETVSNAIGKTQDAINNVKAVKKSLLKRAGILETLQKELPKTLQKGLHDVLRNRLPDVLQVQLRNTLQDHLTDALQNYQLNGLRKWLSKLFRGLQPEPRKWINMIQQELLKVLSKELPNRIENPLLNALQTELADALQNKPFASLQDELLIKLEGQLFEVLNDQPQFADLRNKLQNKYTELLQKEGILDTVPAGSLDPFLDGLLATLQNQCLTALKNKLLETLQKKLPQKLQDKVAHWDYLLTMLENALEHWNAMDASITDIRSQLETAIPTAEHVSNYIKSLATTNEGIISVNREYPNLAMDAECGLIVRTAITSSLITQLSQQFVNLPSSVDRTEEQAQLGNQAVKNSKDRLPAIRALQSQK
jgi:hypothetical protein